MIMKRWEDFLFFFFQAEDGIRDVAVTGVQTCALPISSVDGPPDSLLTLVERLVRQLLATEVASGGRDLVALTTSSLPALQAYLRGRAPYRRGVYEEAARDFERDRKSTRLNSSHGYISY